MVTEKQKANLKIPTSKEARENGRKGGKKSGESRRQLKTWKDILTKMLNTPTNEDDLEVLKKYGVEEEDATLQSFILYKHILSKAMSGDKWAIEKIAQITDNNGSQKIEVEGNMNLTNAQKEIEDLLDD